MKKFEIDTDNSIFDKKHYAVKFFSQAIIIICVIIAIFIVGFSFIYSNAPVTGPSMQPTLNAKGDAYADMVYINKLSNYTYNDIVVIEKETEMINVKYIIKRVIGLPGDRITIWHDASDGKIYVKRNGEKLIEPYIYDNAVGDPNHYGMQTTLNQFLSFRTSVINHPNLHPNVVFNSGELVLQKNQIFVLGDNRAQSTDSSALGPFQTEHVIGRVDFIIPHKVSPFFYFLNFYTGIKLY